MRKGVFTKVEVADDEISNSSGKNKRAKTSTPIRSHMVPRSTGSISSLDSSVVELVPQTSRNRNEDGKEYGALEGEVIELPTVVEDEEEKDDTSVIEVVDNEAEKPEDAQEALMSDTSF